MDDDTTFNLQTENTKLREQLEECERTGNARIEELEAECAMLSAIVEAAKHVKACRDSGQDDDESLAAWELLEQRLHTGPSNYRHDPRPPNPPKGPHPRE